MGRFFSDSDKCVKHLGRNDYISLPVLPEWRITHVRRDREEILCIFSLSAIKENDTDVFTLVDFQTMD